MIYDAFTCRIRVGAISYLD